MGRAIKQVNRYGGRAGPMGQRNNGIFLEQIFLSSPSFPRNRRVRRPRHLEIGAQHCGAINWFHRHGIFCSHLNCTTNCRNCLCFTNYLFSFTFLGLTSPTSRDGNYGDIFVQYTTYCAYFVYLRFFILFDHCLMK